MNGLVRTIMDQIPANLGGGGVLYTTTNTTTGILQKEETPNSVFRELGREKKKWMEKANFGHRR